MFEQLCIIKKNTIDLRNLLEELGYKFVENGVNEWHLPIEELPYLCTLDGGKYMGTNGIWNPSIYINCEDNEDMFLALAALRDDSDNYQWFVRDDYWVECNHPEFHFIGIDPDNFTYIDFKDKFHKATKEEIITKFKK